MINAKIYDSKLNRDFDIIIGKNAQENWDIIDNASQTDIWFHLDDFPSCHVILVTDSNDIKKFNKQTLIYCASLCKTNSKYATLKKIGVIYTKIHNVKKGDKVGSVITTNTKRIEI